MGGDIPNAVDRWVETFGAGPFYWLGRHIAFDEALYEGEPCVLDHSAVIGPWGDIFVELSQVHNISPSSFESKFVGGSADGGAGIAHISFMAEDAAVDNARLDSLGMPAFFFACQGPVAITFHECDLLGHPIEVHHGGDAVTGLFAMIGAQAEGWDGSDPLREIPGPPH
jgi:hypothetical protein